MTEDWLSKSKFKKVHYPESKAGFLSRKRFFVFVGIGIIILIVVYVLFFRGNRKDSRDDISSITARLEKIEKRLSTLEEQFNRLLQSMPNLDASKIIKRRYHVVRRGETLSQIAEQYNLKVNELCLLNQITPKTVIRPGQKLVVSIGSEH